MEKILISALAGCLLGLSCLVGISSQEDEEKAREEQEVKDFQVLQIVVDEAQKISGQRRAKEISVVVDYINYETGKPETNWFQPPHITKKIKRGDCKDLSFLFASIVESKCRKKLNLNPNIYTIFGRTDGYPHSWNYLILGDEAYLVSAQNGSVKEINTVTNKFYCPDKELSRYKQDKIKSLKESPDGEYLEFNDNVPKDKLVDFGITPEERARLRVLSCKK